MDRSGCILWIREHSSSAGAKGVVEIRSQRTEVENKIRNVPADVVELASTITLGEQVVGSLFHQRTAINAYITYFRRDLTMDGVREEVARSSGNKQYTMPNAVYSDGLCPHSSNRTSKSRPYIFTVLAVLRK